MVRRWALAALCVLAHACAFAQNGVSRLVVPVPPGSNLDMVARSLAPRLASATGDNWVVENRPGAESMIGSEYVARAPADGHTMLVAGVSVTLVPLLRKTALAPEDLRAVVDVAQGAYAIVVLPQSPIASAADIATAAATSAQGLNCGAPPGPMGVGCMQLSQRMRGKLKAIPYPGVAPALTALLGGHVDVLVAPTDAIQKIVESGKLRVLATSAPVSGMSAPLMADLWPGFVMEGFIGLFVPASTPDADVRRLNAVVNRALADPAFAGTMRELGQEPMGGTPEQFAQKVARARAHYVELLPRLENPQR